MNSSNEKRYNKVSTCRSWYSNECTLPSCHRFSIYRKYYANLPKTDYITNNLITLPMYSKLTDSEIEFIAQTLRKLL